MVCFNTGEAPYTVVNCRFGGAQRRGDFPLEIADNPRHCLRMRAIHVDTFVRFAETTLSVAMDCPDKPGNDV